MRANNVSNVRGGKKSRNPASYAGYFKNHLCHFISDVDECSTDEHKCNLTTSTCVNKPGNYSCQCKEGYGQTDGLNCVGNNTNKVMQH